jgi:hypothetical protein
VARPLSLASLFANLFAGRTKEFVRKFGLALFHCSGQDKCANDTTQQRNSSLPCLSFISVHTCREYLKIGLNSFGKGRLNVFSASRGIDRKSCLEMSASGAIFDI